jgi:anti-anti-sigma regulatory factor
MKLLRIQLADLLTRHQLPRRVGTRSEGRLVQPDVLGALDKSEQRVVVIDLEGVDLINSSFADETIALPLQRVWNREYGERYLVVATPSLELVEDLQLPLQKRKLSLLAFTPAFGDSWQILGVNKSYFEETLSKIMLMGTGTTGALARSLDISDQACSNRLAELGRRRLIAREREFGAGGGQTHSNRSLLELAH